MKKLILILGILLFSTVIFSNDGLGEFPRNNVKFSNKIFKEEIKVNEGENFVVSPLSLNLAMSLVSNGAVGKTKDEFDKLLQNGACSVKDMNKYNKMLLLNSKELYAEKYNIANGIWIRGEINKSFYDIAKNYYFAATEKLNNKSSDVINNWIEKKTEGKITRMIDNIHPNDLAVIVNTVYFYSDWEKKFPLYKTYESEFTLENGEKVPCYMMRDEGDYKVVDYKEGQILIKKLKGHSAMYFMLPKKGQKLSDYVKSVDFNEIIINDIDGDEFYKIWLPKFKIEYKKNYNEIFKNLGMNRAFSPKTANFTNMCKDKNFYISSILHKAVIGIDEKGCEASAASVIQMKGMTPPHPAQEIHFDRPFAFALVDELDNIVIFEGCLYNPNAE